MESSELLTGEVIILYLKDIPSPQAKNVLALRKPRLLYGQGQYFLRGELYYPGHATSWAHSRQVVIPMNSVAYYIEFQTEHEYVNAKPKKRSFWG
ncbi:MAG: hypothetical protein HJJLKODD_02963 [Phycisphaerae bacterium]|nr:hypothetical protein [Phycisphaerae bacterium]